MKILKTIGILLILFSFASVSYAATSGSQQMKISIEEDIDISIPPEVVDILPIGHLLSPDAYHLHVLTEPFTKVYITNSSGEVFEGLTDENGDVWIEVMLDEEGLNNLQIVVVDYWGNSALSQLSLSKRKGSEDFDFDYQELGKADDTVRDLAVQLASYEETSPEEQILGQINELVRRDPSLQSSASKKAWEAINSPYGYAVMLIGAIFLTTGLYLRSTTKDDQ